MDYQTLAASLGNPAAIAAMLVWGQWLDRHHYCIRPAKHGGIDVGVLVDDDKYITFHVAASDVDTTQVSWVEDGFSEELYILCSESSVMDDGEKMSPMDQLMLLVDCCDNPKKLGELSAYCGENYSSYE